MNRVQVTVISFAVILVLGFGSYIFFAMYASTPESEKIKTLERQRRKEINERNELRLTVDRKISKLIYMKDPRTNVCFAYMWDNWPNAPSDGGPALATVPCDSIPANLLFEAFGLLEQTQ